MLRILKKYIIRFLGEKSYERIRGLADHFLYYRETTYSQFGEDLVLRRIFKDKRKGFFVDIGAFHPKQYSNTYWLYKNLGWEGLNVEPRPGSAKLFRRLRPRDVSLEVAVGPPEEERRLYSWGLNSGNTCRPEQAEAMRAEYGEPRAIIRVKQTTLSSLLADFLPPSRQIDLLSVDVEGLDLEVLKTNDWHIYKPRVVLVELFAETAEEVLASGLHLFMTSRGYSLTHILKPTLIYKRADQDML